MIGVTKNLIIIKIIIVLTIEALILVINILNQKIILTMILIINLQRIYL